MARRKKQPEFITGLYSAIPHVVMDSKAFIKSSDRAKSLIYALMRQHNGSNNGWFQLTDKWLREHGWPSAGMNLKTRKELIERGLIILTRSGGLNAGCNYYAVTWLGITNFVGLDISARTYPQGAWHECEVEATRRRKPPQKRVMHSGQRSGATPTTGAIEVLTTLTTGANRALSGAAATPTTGNNVYNQYPTYKLTGSVRRIVGKVGRSGIFKKPL
jgi:hypothetical protein